jgi:hypothetical protein
MLCGVSDPRFIDWGGWKDWDLIPCGFFLFVFWGARLTGLHDTAWASFSMLLISMCNFVFRRDYHLANALRRCPV